MNLKKISIFFQRNINYIIVITIILVAFSATFGSSTLETLRLLKMKNDLINQIAEGQEQNSQLDEEIAQIGTQSHIERVARMYLELYYPNEQIVIPVENSLQEQAKNNKKDNTQDSQESIQNDETTNSEIEPAEEIIAETTEETLSPEETELDNSEQNIEETEIPEGE